MPVRFAWDIRKAEANLRKHGVDFVEAATVFEDPLSITVSEPDHSVDEERFILIGRSKQQHLVVLAHIERSETIRIISARSASRRERVMYEEGE